MDSQDPWFCPCSCGQAWLVREQLRISMDRDFGQASYSILLRRKSARTSRFAVVLMVEQLSLACFVPLFSSTVRLDNNSRHAKKNFVNRHFASPVRVRKKKGKESYDGVDRPRVAQMFYRWATVARYEMLLLSSNETMTMLLAASPHLISCSIWCYVELSSILLLGIRVVVVVEGEDASSGILRKYY